MSPKRSYAFVNRLSSPAGFTLIEALIAVALLALVAVGLSVPYISGFQALDVQADFMLLDSCLRSRMERLIASDFDSLSNGQEDMTVNGQVFKIMWKVSAIDLNGDGHTESNAKKVEVYLINRPGRLLTTIRVDNEGKVGKIS